MVLSPSIVQASRLKAQRFGLHMNELNDIPSGITNILYGAHVHSSRVTVRGKNEE